MAHPLRPRPLQQHRSPSGAAGFTLVELIVASAIGVLVALAGVAASVQNLRTTTGMVTAQQLRDNWSKLALLINTDISEACGATAAGTTLTLRVIAPANITANNNPACDNNAVQIQYTLVGDVLQRSGPLVDVNGTLNFNAVAPPNAPQNLISGVTQFTPSINSGFEPRYTLQLSGGGKTYAGAGATTVGGRARVRSFD
jgi:prepilin-type N-terminal cleavage/methylation domain-containing protein